MRQLQMARQAKPSPRAENYWIHNYDGASFPAGVAAGAITAARTEPQNRQRFTLSLKIQRVSVVRRRASVSKPQDAKSRNKGRTASGHQLCYFLVEMNALNDLPVWTMFLSWRCVMRTFIAALALTSLIAIASLTQTANAAPVSPSSSAFGGNGY